jgi:opacity protein-like surface antigen
MKKFVLALMALVVFAAPAAAAIEVEGDAYAGIYDKYMWRGFNLSGSKPVLQMGTDISAKGFTFSYWTNTQLSSGGGYKHDEITETDVVLDYSFDVNDLLSVSVGDIYYNFNAEGNTHELYLSAGLNTILAPSLTIYYDYDAASGGAADGSDLAGLYYALAVGHDLELAENLGLSLGAALNYNDESPFVGEYSEMHNYELSVGVSYAVNDQISIDASAIYSDAISDEAELAIGKDGESTGGVSVTLAF